MFFLFKMLGHFYEGHFYDKGYVIARALLDVDAAKKEMQQHFPVDADNNHQDFGSSVGTFFSTPALNDITVNPLLLSIVRHLIGTHEILLSQSVAWAKYGHTSNGPSSNRDQRIHMDYGNHYWTVPPEDWSKPEAIAAIIYYSNTTETGGATAVVPRRGTQDKIYQWPFPHMPGICGAPFINQKEEAEEMMQKFSPASAKIRQECYDREVQEDFKPGDVLFYRMDTWHRGTPVLPGKVRHVHNLVWKRKDAQGIQQWNPGFTQSMYSGRLEKFIAGLDAEQLETLGFPARDSEKWASVRFREAVENRYKGMDLQKYMYPPPVPQYWYFSQFKIESSLKPRQLKRELFDWYCQAGVHISGSSWKYTITKNDLKIDCYFFWDGTNTIVDINLLSGDRWAWSVLRNQMQQWRPSSSKL